MEIRTRQFTALLLASLFMISGCEQPPPTIEASSRPVKTMVIGGERSVDSRSFPAVVDAIQKANISFRVSGKIVKMSVKEGDLVRKDQLLAQLDQTDFKITLKDRQANFDTANANYDRAKSLVGEGAISRTDHDTIRARFFASQSALEAANQDLIYTQLKANFDGQIAKRHAEIFEEVKASQEIFSLEDVSSLKLKIDVPENLMISINRNKTKTRVLYATFDTIKGETFPLEFSEASTRADPNTRTFKITLKMKAPKKHNILPGMTATVVAELGAEESGTETLIAVPASAVVADDEKQATVWIVDEETMTVMPRQVTPGLLVGHSILVEGLNQGDRIVVAGAAYLRKEMKVTLLETGEQPEQ